MLIPKILSLSRDAFKKQLYLFIGIHVENFTVEVQKGLSHETIHQFSKQSTVYIT